MQIPIPTARSAGEWVTPWDSSALAAIIIRASLVAAHHRRAAFHLLGLGGLKMKTHWYRQIPKADPDGFGLLSFKLRATALMMLRVADEQGRIQLHGMKPGDAIVRLCGASGNERRTVRRTVDELVALGVFAHTAIAPVDALLATNWAASIFPAATLPPMPPLVIHGNRVHATPQGGLAPAPHGGEGVTPDATPMPTESTTDARRVQNGNAISDSVVQPMQPRPAESLGEAATSIVENIIVEKSRRARVTGHTPQGFDGSLTPHREEKRREKERRENSLSSSPSVRDELRDVETVTSIVRRWSRQKEVGRPWGGGSAGAHGLIRGALRHLYDVADAEGVDLEQATRITLIGFQNTERCKSRGFPLRWWAEDPGSFLPRYRQSLVEKSKAKKMEAVKAQAERADELEPDQVMSPEETRIAFDNLLSGLGGSMKMGAA